MLRWECASRAYAESSIDTSDGVNCAGMRSEVTASRIKRIVSRSGAMAKASSARGHRALGLIRALPVWTILSSFSSAKANCPRASASRSRQLQPGKGDQRLHSSCGSQRPSPLWEAVRQEDYKRGSGLRGPASLAVARTPPRIQRKFHGDRAYRKSPREYAAF